MNEFTVQTSVHDTFATMTVLNEDGLVLDVWVTQRNGGYIVEVTRHNGEIKTEVVEGVRT